MMTAYRLYEVLLAHPHLGIDGVGRERDACLFAFAGAIWRYDGAVWQVDNYSTPAKWPTFDSPDDGDRVRAEIHRVLAVVMGARVPDTASTDHLQDRLTDEMDRRRDAEQALAKITDAHAVVSQRLAGSQKEVAERDATIESNEAKVIDLTLRLGETQNRVADLESELAGVRDNADRLRRDLDFMNQRRANAQKRVTDLEQQRDDYQAAVEVQRTRANVNDTRATKAEARVKRLLRQRNAAHDVLDEAAIGLEPEGSPRWTLARRCRAAVAPVWGYLDAMQAFDVVGEIVGVTGKTGERGFIDAVITRVKALHQDDDHLTRLISYHQAPITFNARPLTLAERACFVIRRLWQGRANAANEAASLRRELGDIADALGDLPGTAEREPIGDREEHLGLSTAERIRLSR